MPETAPARVLPPIAAHWVRNNVMAAGIFGAVSLVIFGLRHALGADDAAFGAAVISAVMIVLWALAGAANGVLGGAVLQRIVPLLPVWSWIGLQVAIALIVSIGLVANSTSVLGDAPRTPDLTVGEALLWGGIAGALLGAVVGGLEALVLRKVALGTGNWVAWSAVSHALGWSLVLVSATLWDFGTDFFGELAATALWLVAAALGAVVMLPALQGLKSRMLSAAGQHFT